MILEKMAAKDGCNAPLTMAPMVPASKYGHSETLRRITSKNDTVGTCSSCKNRGTDGGSSSEKHWSYEEKRGPFSNVKSNIRFCPFRNMVDNVDMKKGTQIPSVILDLIALTSSCLSLSLSCSGASVSANEEPRVDRGMLKLLLSQ